MELYKPPSYPSNTDGVARVENMTGGRVKTAYDSYFRKDYGQYRYVWSNKPDTSWSHTNNGLAIGPFSVTVIDDSGCTLTLQDRFLSAASKSKFWRKITDSTNIYYLSPLEGFQYGIDQIKVPPKYYLDLDDIAMYLNQHESFRIKVIGYGFKSDRISNDALKDLSLQRALNVKEYLISKGVDEHRILSIGAGSGANSNNKPEKRIEIILLR